MSGQGFSVTYEQWALEQAAHADTKRQLEEARKRDVSVEAMEIDRNLCLRRAERAEAALNLAQNPVSSHASLIAELVEAKKESAEWQKLYRQTSDRWDDAIKERNAEQLLRLSHAQVLENYTKANREAQARITELEARLKDYEDDFKTVMSEKCAQDERHCTCVPHLRTRIKELELQRDPERWVSAQVERLEAALKESEDKVSDHSQAYAMLEMNNLEQSVALKESEAKHITGGALLTQAHDLILGWQKRAEASESREKALQERLDRSMAQAVQDGIEIAQAFRRKYDAGECQCWQEAGATERAHHEHCPEQAALLMRGYCDRIKELLEREKVLQERLAEVEKQGAQ